MSYYPREEQETTYNYDTIDKLWRVDSSYPPHIRKILEVGSVTNTHKDEEGRIIYAAGTVEPNQVRLFKPRN